MISYWIGFKGIEVPGFEVKKVALHKVDVVTHAVHAGVMARKCHILVVDIHVMNWGLNKKEILDE